MSNFAAQLSDYLRTVLEKLPGRTLVTVSISATAVTALLLAVLSPFLFRGIQRYNDLVVGEITVADAYKHGDIVAPFAAILIFAVVWSLIALLAARYSGPPKQTTPAPVSEPESQRLPHLFFCYFAGILVVRNNVSYKETGILLLSVLICWFFFHRRSNTSDAAPSGFPLLCGIVTAGGLFFSAAALAVATKFFFPHALSLFPLHFPFYAACLGFPALFLFSRLPLRSSLYVVYGAQFLTPLLLLAGFTRVYRFGGELTPNLSSLTTRTLAVAVVTVVLLASARTIGKRLQSVSTSPGDLVLLPSLIGVAGFMAYATPVFLNSDLFHSGELMLSWQQLFEKGQAPFSGFAVARGFGDALPGFLNLALFDGTYATFSFAHAVNSVPIAAANAALFCSLVGTGWGAVFVIAAPGQANHLLLTVLLLLVQPKLLSRPLLWLFIWLLITPLFCLYHTTSGIAMAAGSMPLAAWVAYVALKEGHLVRAWREHRPRLVAGFTVLAAVLMLIAPTLAAWAGYVLEQGQVNEVANGTALLREMPLATWFQWQSKWAWEGYRVGGWLLGCFMLWHLLIRERIEKIQAGAQTLLGSLEAVALTGIATTVMFIPYSMGRIDGKGLSRTGAVMTIVIGVLLPLVLLLKKKGRTVPVLFAALFLMGVGGAFHYQSPSDLARKALAVVETPSDAQWVEGRTLGLANFGNCFADQDTLANVMAIKTVMGKILRPGESYLDLTNHVGYYYLLDHKVTSVYAGYYTAVSEQIQNRVIAALKKNPPPLVWAGPARTFGSGSASLRSYRVYRWLLQNGYQPLQANNIRFLVRADRYQELFSLFPGPPVRAQELSDTFHEQQLAGIPLAWGRNMDRLARRFRSQPTTLRQTSLTWEAAPDSSSGSAPPVVVAELAAGGPIIGGECDFLLLRISGATGLQRVRVSWSEPDNRYADWRSVTFDARSESPLLIPLGSHPDWLLARRIGKIRLELLGIERSRELVLGPLVFLSLVK